MKTKESIILSIVVVLIIIDIHLLTIDPQSIRTSLISIGDLNWLFQIIISIVVAVFIFLQLRVNKLLAEFKFMPTVFFILKSGGTDYSQKNDNKKCQSLIRKLDTRLVLINRSRFTVYFNVKMDLRVEYKNNTKKQLKHEKHEVDWSKYQIYPGKMDGHDCCDILGKVIVGDRWLEKIKPKFNWDDSEDSTEFDQKTKKELNREIRKIK